MISVPDTSPENQQGTAQPYPGDSKPAQDGKLLPFLEIDYSDPRLHRAALLLIECVKRALAERQGEGVA
jgi:hypothetical protein